MPKTAPASPGLTLDSRQGRWILAATVLGSGMAMLDSTVVNVALRVIGDGLHTSLDGLQWTVTAYTLTLAGLILLGGSLGDRLGRRRIFLIGVAWFAVASALCGLAPSIGVLIAARALQGIGGALLTPGSLAIIQSSFTPAERPRVIGAWSGLGGVAAAVGPLVGGEIVDTIGWRWIFLINLPVAALVIAVSVRHMPETSDPTAHGRFDIAGAALAALALAGITAALIAAPAQGLAWALPAGAIGVAAAVAFVLLERRRERAGGGTPPMMPLSVFASRQFSAVNAVTLLVYAALSGFIFLLVLELQVVSRFSPLAAGLALLPATVAMLLLSSRAGAFAQRYGPRWLMTAGPLIAAAGLLLATRAGFHASYAADVLPSAILFGLGLAATVAPLTATVLASADVRHAGVASGVNNAVARAAGLIAVAGLPLAVGLGSSAAHDAHAFHTGFQAAMVICAGLLVLGALLAAVSIDNGVLRADDAHPVPEPECRTTCPVSAPPLEPGAPRVSTRP